ncbi:hypothetical protein XYCOK13_36120 [Xylanibacillus composti]|uniref:Uncharacterized protein n=1 Tax=Xylanibacillus composti TaxID=1572762 RepID=A0A8J4H8R5_9BACL|nr:hypothetical protein XYCOK13_36120 [Xylanibacillus composti]
MVQAFEYCSYELRAEICAFPPDRLIEHDANQTKQVVAEASGSAFELSERGLGLGILLPVHWTAINGAVCLFKKRTL